MIFTHVFTYLPKVPNEFCAIVHLESEGFQVRIQKSITLQWAIRHINHHSFVRPNSMIPMRNTQ